MRYIEEWKDLKQDEKQAFREFYGKIYLEDNLEDNLEEEYLKKEFECGFEGVFEELYDWFKQRGVEDYDEEGNRLNEEESFEKFLGEIGESRIGDPTYGDYFVYENKYWCFLWI